MAGENTLTDASFVVNGRLSLGGLDLTRDGKLEIALWARNLFNEQHLFVKSHASYAFIGDYGVYNDPRTFGLDATLRF
jgi:iron complex outermembrane receptor protein